MSQMQNDNYQQQKKNLSTGRCKWFNSSKGYGFIEMDDKTDDVFVHQSALKCRGFRSLQEGESLEFEIQTDNNGRRKAINVTGPNGDYCIGEKREYQDNNNYGGGGYGNNNRGYGNNSGGYGGGRGGYNNNRGGYNNNGGGRGGYNNNNSYGGGYNNNRGGYNNRRY